jgi:hypothetical protein
MRLPRGERAASEGTGPRGSDRVEVDVQTLAVVDLRIPRGRRPKKEALAGLAESM